MANCYTKPAVLIHFDFIGGRTNGDYRNESETNMYMYMNRIRNCNFYFHHIEHVIISQNM